MVRMSDILKKVRGKKANIDKKEPPAEQVPPEQIKPPQPISEKPQDPNPITPPQPPKVEPENKPEIEQKTLPEPAISPYRVVKYKPLDLAESVNLYGKIRMKIMLVYNIIKSGKEIGDQDRVILDQVRELIDQICLGNEGILAMTMSIVKDDFLFNHVLNVCMMAIDIGVGLGYNKAQLLELGAAAILHDIGMMKHYNIYNQPRKLSAREYEEIKHHPELGAEIIDKFKNVSKRVVTIVGQHHERVDGSGYPRGLKGDAIDEYAKIIRMVDEYEAMTHSRPYREELSPHAALKEFIYVKDSFEKKIIKTMVERIALPFPLGSYVKLNSGEKGKIIKRNFSSPLRPVVEIMYGANGDRLEITKTIDLDKHDTIFIEKPWIEEIE